MRLLQRVSSQSSGRPVLIPLHDAHLYSRATSRSRSPSRSPSRSRSRSCSRPAPPSEAIFPNHDNAQDTAPTGRDSSSQQSQLADGRAFLRSSREFTIDSLRREVREGDGGKWTDYEIKAKLVNKAMQDIGMGRYHWQLFVLCGFGWFADSFWIQGVSLILPSLSAEFGVAEKTVRYTTTSLFAGLCIGSFGWGLASDVLGRQLAFNVTIVMTGLCGLAMAVAPSWPSVCAALACLGLGVGGNLPVDGALFLEFLPEDRSYLLTLLSVWWPVGNLSTALIGWIFVGHWPPAIGWRLSVLTLALATLAMSAIRALAFRILESPKYLLGRGRDNDAVTVVHEIARRNRAKTWLTLDLLHAVSAASATSTGARDSEVDDQSCWSSPPQSHFNDTDNDLCLDLSSSNPSSPTFLQFSAPGRRPSLSIRNSAASVLKQRLSTFSANRLRPLFRTRTLAQTTCLIWFIWACIGMGYPLFNAFLPQYMSHLDPPASIARMTGSPAPKLSPDTYRRLALASIAGVPGSLLATYLVERPWALFGRRGTLATSTLATAVLMCLFARYGTTPHGQVGFSAANAFTQNIMYAVLYAMTPELFQSPIRGAGAGIASLLNRVAGLFAPVVAATVPGDGGASGPVYIASVLILLAFAATCLLPVETRGAQRL